MSDVVRQFETRAGTYSASANWISDEGLIRAHIDACGIKPSARVLELCCGTGMVGRAFVDAGYSVCGVDLTRGMAEEANRFFPCVCTTAEEVPFLDGAFDIVVLRQAYFLLDDGPRVLAEAHRVLRPGGVLVFSQTVPFSDDDREWLEQIHRTKQRQLREFHTEATLAADLSRDHFEIASVRRLSVRENIDRWMAAAPELAPELRAEVVRLVAESPDAYRRLHDVKVGPDGVTEDWNWVIFTARKK